MDLGVRARAGLPLREWKSRAHIVHVLRSCRQGATEAVTGTRPRFDKEREKLIDNLCLNKAGLLGMGVGGAGRCERDRFCFESPFSSSFSPPPPPLCFPPFHLQTLLVLLRAIPEGQSTHGTTLALVLIPPSSFFHLSHPLLPSFKPRCAACEPFPPPPITTTTTTVINYDEAHKRFFHSI